MARKPAAEGPRHLRVDVSRHVAMRSMAIALFVAACTVAGVEIFHPTRTPTHGHSIASSARPDEAPTPAQQAASWQQAVAPAVPLLTGRPSLRPAAGVPSTAGLSAVLTPLLAVPVLAADRVDVVVGDAMTGRVLFDRGGADVVLPASTAKLAIAVAALRALGPDHRFVTRVVQGSGPTQIILVGAGDPTLAGPQAVGAFAPGYPDPAKLSDLAAQTASALHAKGIAAVSVGYDATLFTGASTAVGWKPSYITDGNVAPVSALEVDEGRIDLQRRGRSADPAMAAATAFATLLATDGITVTGNTRPVRASGARPMLASVSSPPVADLVQRMLGRSDNDLAEALARHVAIAGGLPATFGGGAEAVEHVLGALGIDRSAFSLVDSSGLSAADQLRPAGLVQLLQVAMRPTHTEFAPMLAGLPVSGFSGTLEERFEGAAAMGEGVVRAKTGTLDGVVALAGYVDDAAGRTLVVAVVANGVALNATDMTEAALDRIVAGLALCGCR